MVTLAAVVVQPVAVVVKFAACDWPFGTLALGGLRLNTVDETLIDDGASQNRPVSEKVRPLSVGSSLPLLSTVVVTVSGPGELPSEQRDATLPVTANVLGGAASADENAPTLAATETSPIENLRII